MILGGNKPVQRPASNSDARKRREGTVGESSTDTLRVAPSPLPHVSDEPLGLGAVIVNDTGEHFVRHDGWLAPWYAIGARDKQRPWRYFEDIGATEVLSWGVPQ